MTMTTRPAHVSPVPVSELIVAAGLDPDALDGDDVVVTGATVDSRNVHPGDLFGAFAGIEHHGAQFAPQAVAAGAAAILTDAAGRDTVRALGLTVPVVVAPNEREAMGRASAAVYGNPSSLLSLVGITGTNGKTTTSFLLEGALSSHAGPSALLGTVEMRLGHEHQSATRTTVESPVLQGFLARAVEEGSRFAVTEASSQAIALERLAGTHFAVALFTNLQYEHIDFHHTMEEYFSQKKRLFTPALSDRAVVLVDDEWGQRLAREATVPVVTVATRPGSPRADWNVEGAAVTARGGMAFSLIDPNGDSHAVESPLPGIINVSNAAGAIVVAHMLGVPIGEAIAGLAAARPVPGRTEIVTTRTEATPLTVVDYAHTPDGLASVLDAMRSITPGRLIVVFGCDGLRDDSKRPGLGVAAATHADVVIVTDENPRTEPADYIRSRLLEGVDAMRPDRRDVYEVEPRATAVFEALRLAGPLDTVIATGKGHETTQEVGTVHYPYTDAGAFRDAFAALEALRGSESP